MIPKGAWGPAKLPESQGIGSVEHTIGLVYKEAQRVCQVRIRTSFINLGSFLGCIRLRLVTRHDAIFPAFTHFRGLAAYVEIPLEAAPGHPRPGYATLYPDPDPAVPGPILPYGHVVMSSVDLAALRPGDSYLRGVKVWLLANGPIIIQ